MYFKREEELVEKIIKEHDIPFSLTLAEAIYDIIWFGRFKEEDFRKLIPYLKERATRDVNNYEKEHPLFSDVLLADWTFYLQEYAYYIKEMLHGGVNRYDMKKYLYPADIYDITYNYKNNSVKYFLRCMNEHYPESTKQVIQ